MADLREQLRSGLAERYELQRELGRGGMATVFLATDLKHKRPVALKVLHPEVERLAPASTAQLAVVRAAIEQGAGRFDSAIVHLQQAQTLDPRSVIIPRRLSYLQLVRRRYPEALEAADRALVLAPRNLAVIEQKAMVLLARGDLGGARQVIRAAAGTVDHKVLVAYVATYFDLFWLLDDAQQDLLFRLPPSAFNDDRAYWGRRSPGRTPCAATRRRCGPTPIRPGSPSSNS